MMDIEKEKNPLYSPEFVIEFYGAGVTWVQDDDKNAPEHIDNDNNNTVDGMGVNFVSAGYTTKYGIGVRTEIGMYGTARDAGTVTDAEYVAAHRTAEESTLSWEGGPQSRYYLPTGVYVGSPTDYWVRLNGGIGIALQQQWDGYDTKEAWWDQGFRYSRYVSHDRHTTSFGVSPYLEIGVAVTSLLRPGDSDGGVRLSYRRYLDSAWEDRDVQAVCLGAYIPVER